MFQKRLPEEHRTLELVDYNVNVHAIEIDGSGWKFCLEIYDNLESEDPEQATPVILLYGQKFFPQYEYAIENAYEAIEALGFDVETTQSIDLYRSVGGENLDVETVVYDGDTFLTKKGKQDDE